MNRALSHTEMCSSLAIMREEGLDIYQQDIRPNLYRYLQIFAIGEAGTGQATRVNPKCPARKDER
jgi:hypothetical protein